MVEQRSKKRKAEVADAVSEEDEFGGALLDGVLSASEGEEDYDEEDGLDKEDEDDSAESIVGDESADEDEDEDDEELLSDEIPPSEDEDDGSLAGRAKRIDLNATISKKQAESEPHDDDDNDDTPNYRQVTDANGGVRYEYAEINPVYDSDDSDAQDAAGANTIGNIPLSFYDSYPHIGYDINGKRIMRPAAGDALDALLDSIEVPAGWTGLTDPATGKPLQLSKDELELLRRLQMNEMPEDGFDPYPDTIEYFTSIEEKMPLSAAPEPKRRFVPSKHEARRVAKIVRAIREGRILPFKPAEERQREEEKEEEQYFDLWANEEPREPHAMHMPAPKMLPPGYDLSYNPPTEYLPTPAEREAWETADPEDREKEYVPAKFDALRKVPAYAPFIKERFDRCLDLYLAPRVRRTKLNIDPESLLPKLPRPEELRPFPTMCQTVFKGHDGRVRSVSVSPDGLWLASGGDDGTVRVWALNGHQEWMAKISSDEPVNVVRWRPTRETCILAAAAGDDIFLMVPTVAGNVVEAASRDVLDAGFGHAVANAAKDATLTTASGARKDPPGKWGRPGARLEDQGVLVRVTVRDTVKVVSWHRRGDFFSTTAPRGQRSSVAIHTLSKHLTQIPFRRLPGIAQVAHFHPTRPLFFVATQRAIRVYDLQRQELVKVLQPGAQWISSFDIHPGGDNVVVGSYDRRLTWHDLDLSTRPYRTMRFHPEAVRAVRFHRGGVPLFADASDDGVLQVFHAKVVADLTENATIVPVKMLRGHQVVGRLGVMDLDWHPRHPWLVSAGADGTCRLWT